MRTNINMPVGAGYSEDTTGYVGPTRFFMDHRPKNSAFYNGYRAKISLNNVRLHFNPHIKSKVLEKISINQYVNILSSRKTIRIGKLGIHRWYKVKWKDKIGWIYGAFLK